MKRDPKALAREPFDLVVVGGGICGVCVAWDAALRGLSVALLERGDFGSATSSHSLKIVHGGIRYLQHADVQRVRESAAERSAFLRMAPHLVRPLPFTVPTYGQGMQGRTALALAFTALGLLTSDRNRGIDDPERAIPGGHLISRAEVLERFPGLVEERGLTGAGIFHDGQMYDPPRIVLSILRSAIEAGAAAANYCEASALLSENGRVTGVTAADTLTGERFDVRGRMVVNAAGPFAEEFLVRAGLRSRRSVPLSRDMAVVIDRRLLDGAALAMQTKYRDPAAVFARGNRHLFMVPWRDYTLIGVHSRPYEGEPSRLTVTEEEVRGFLDEINEANPRLGLTLDDVSVVNAGLLPFGENEPASDDLTFGKRSHLIDHASDGGPEGLVTAMSVRFTTGRGLAERAIDLAFRKMGRTPPPCRTAWTRVSDARFARFSDLRDSAVKAYPSLAPEVVTHLVHNHGIAYRAVMDLACATPALAERVGTSLTLKAEVVHGIRAEMAQKLSDIVLRRTGLGTGAFPGEPALAECGGLMAAELGWSADRTRDEMDAVRANYSSWRRGAEVGR